MEVKWAYMKKAFEEDTGRSRCFRSLHKITNNHMVPTIQFSMKVKLAAPVFSRTMVAFLYTACMMSRGMFPQEVLPTTCFVSLMDLLLNNFNGNARLTPRESTSLLLRNWCMSRTHHKRIESGNPHRRLSVENLFGIIRFGYGNNIT